jgi:hypothetical protein
MKNCQQYCDKFRTWLPSHHSHASPCFSGQIYLTIKVKPEINQMQKKIKVTKANQNQKFIEIKIV